MFVHEQSGVDLMFESDTDFDEQGIRKEDLVKWRAFCECRESGAHLSVGTTFIPKHMLWPMLIGAFLGYALIAVTPDSVFSKWTRNSETDYIYLAKYGPLLIAPFIFGYAAGSAGSIGGRRDHYRCMSLLTIALVLYGAGWQFARWDILWSKVTFGVLAISAVFPAFCSILSASGDNHTFSGEMRFWKAFAERHRHGCYEHILIESPDSVSLYHHESTVDRVLYEGSRRNAHQLIREEETRFLTHLPELRYPDI
jgi:hypothetical protein